jgi:hemin uptake protein HemP
MTDLREAMKATDRLTTPTHEEDMFAVALNAQARAISPRTLFTGHDVRQTRIIARMLVDAPQVTAQETEIVGDKSIVSSETLAHMAAAVEAMDERAA